MARSLWSKVLKISLNGEPREFERECSLAELLVVLGVDFRCVAIELRGAVIPRAEFDRATVHNGDRVEIVRFVQGG